MFGKQRVWLLLFVALAALYAGLAAWANADLTVGRFALFMDERITFDGVRNILNPGGLDRFIWNITDGGDHRYGRVLWNVMALLCFLPEHLYGEAGQIFAGRMTGVLILLSAFSLLCVTFVRRWDLRCLLMAALLAMPYTEYYMTMPKPEPLQMLFLALFLFFFKKSGMSFAGSYWIFLGLAFGAKISTLPLVAVFGLAACLKHVHDPDPEKAVREILGAVGHFLVGLAIAVPVLLFNVAASILLFQGVQLLARRRAAVWRWKSRLTVASLLVAGNLLSELSLRGSGTRTGVAVWVASTFLNTGHGSDQSSIGFGSWVDFALHEWSGAPAAITAALFAAGFASAALFLTGNLKKRLLPGNLPSNLPLIVTAGGVALNLAVFTAVHRLWGFYLFPGTVLMIVGFVAISEAALPAEKAAPAAKHPDAGYCLSLSSLSLMSVVALLWWFPESVYAYKRLAGRTGSAEFRQNYQSHREITGFLSRYAAQKRGPVSVSFDPALFPPESNAQYLITEFWTRSPDWKNACDVIIVGKRHTPRCTPVPEHAPGYPAYLRERHEYESNVIYPGSGSGDGKRYRRMVELSNGGEILISTGAPPPAHGEPGAP